MDVIIPTTLGQSSFTRASTATYYNSAGLIASAANDVLRLSYDPTNLSAAPTPLLEPSATNNAYSENFLWSGLVVQSGFHSTCEYMCATAPDGRYFADKIVEDFAASTTHGCITGTGGPSTSAPQTYSVFAKAGERTVLEIVTNASVGHAESWKFDLIAGTVSGTGTFTTAAIFNSSNGWYRCSVSGPGNEVYNMQLNLVSGGTHTYSGDGKSGLYLWGQQGESGLAVTSYIPTVPTFSSRAGSAYYINSSGNLASAATNVARNSYNADNLSLSPRLLFEPAATNLCLQSSTFTTTWVVTNGGGTTASQADPTGGTGGSLLNDASNTATAKWAQAITIANNSTGYIFSIYVKKVASTSSYPGIELTFTGGSTPLNTSVTLNTVNGTMTTNAAAGSSPIYTRVDSSNGWWRFSIGLYNNSTGNTTANVAIYPAVSTDASGNWSVAAIGNNGPFWGAQLETSNVGYGPFTTNNMTRTSYIATTTTSVTRAADVISNTYPATRAVDNPGIGLLSSNIPENDFPAWNSGTTYAVDVSGSNSVVYKHVKYASLQASNTNHQPDISPTWWSVIGATNQYAMIDSQVGTQTVGTVGGHIIVYMKIGAQPTMSFLNMVADSVTVKIISNYAQVYSTTIDLTGGSSGVPVTDYTLTGLPTYSDAIVVLDIYSAALAPACGNFVVGTKYYLGSTETNPTLGIIDYSIKSVDAFGNPTLTKRGYAKRMNTKSLVDNAQVDVVARIMAQVRATPCVWNANTNMNNLTSNLKTSLIIYGYYKDWEIDCDNPNKSYLTCQIEGLI